MKNLPLAGGALVATGVLASLLWGCRSRQACPVPFTQPPPGHVALTSVAVVGPPPRTAEGEFVKVLARRRPTQRAFAPISWRETRSDTKPPALPRYVVTDLGTLPGGTFSRAFGLNNRGEVVGESQFRAFLWRDGKMEALSTLGGFRSVALRLNDRGQIVGFSETIARAGSSYDPPVYHSVLWQGGKIRDLAPFTGGRINARGQIAGSRTVGTSPGRHRPVLGRALACLWDDGKLTDLGLLPGTGSSGALGLNNKGQVVGSAGADGTGNGRAFLWEGGKMKGLGALPGGEYRGSAAGDINDKGQVVGSSWGGSTEANHAFLWERGQMTDLGTLGGIFSAAAAVNEVGQVVGVAYTARGRPGSEYPGYAFLWQKGKMLSLNDLIPAGSGWVLRQAHDINDRGQIVGEGRLNGQERGFLLTPVRDH